jgi:hypothetical protein
MFSMDDDLTQVARALWSATAIENDPAKGPLHRLKTTGPRVVQPAAFDVTGVATGAVAVATLAAAQLLSVRRESPVPAVTVDSLEASAAFAAEVLFSPVGWAQPPLWDPIAGNYRAADGWVRLHTNYAHHRAAAEKVLNAHDREAVREAVSALPAEEIEGAIVTAGGAAAAMHGRNEWLSSPPGAATADAPTLTARERQLQHRVGWAEKPGQLPFSGVRVLDLTRVIAGPVCTKFLAGYGADVLRVDPPGFPEVPSLLPETTLGKRTATLDLTSPDDRVGFEELLRGADVLVLGLRADAIGRLGYDDQTILAENPDLIIASLDAYGWAGQWRERRGFDSLVQMSCGIAADGATVAGRDEPTPLPYQALDHATGWLLAGAIALALTREITETLTARVHASLIGTANLLYKLPPPEARALKLARKDLKLEETMTVWGAAKRVPMPGDIEGIRPRWAHQAGPLGRHRATWDEL